MSGELREGGDVATRSAYPYPVDIVAKRFANVDAKRIGAMPDGCAMVRS